MEKRKKKMLITIAYIIAVITMPLIIGLLDTLLPSTFRMAIILTTAVGCVVIVDLWE